MANQHTKANEKSKNERIAELIRKRQEAETMAEGFAKERAEAEKKCRAAKKVASECTAAIAEIAVE